MARGIGTKTRRQASSNRPVNQGRGSKKKNSRTASESNSSALRRQWIIIGGILLFSLALISTWAMVDNGFRAAKEQRDFESYLYERYKEKFVVTNIRTEGSGFGVPGELVADATPVDNSNLTFQVSKSKSQQKYSDRYPQALWSSQEQRLIKDDLKALLKANVDYSVSIELRLLQGTASLVPIPDGPIVSSSEALKKYKGNIIYILSLKEAVNYMSATPTDPQLIETLNIINYLKTKGVSFEVNYLYHPNSSAAASELQYGFNIKQKDIDNINNIDDLRSYYKLLD